MAMKKYAFSCGLGALAAMALVICVSSVVAVTYVNTVVGTIMGASFAIIGAKLSNELSSHGDFILSQHNDVEKKCGEFFIGAGALTILSSFGLIKYLPAFVQAIFFGVVGGVLSYGLAFPLIVAINQGLTDLTGAPRALIDGISQVKVVIYSCATLGFATGLSIKFSSANPDFYSELGLMPVWVFIKSFCLFAAVLGAVAGLKTAQVSQSTDLPSFKASNNNNNSGSATQPSTIGSRLDFDDDDF